ncbi:MAG: glycosyltransferase family 2 protein [Candidatus Omnitrophica bacterium]|nr:glycosyltransferase family 2 protein [Candidatus Omnitrophota bacterium]
MKNQKQIFLSIIIVSFNTKNLLKSLLNSIPQKKEWEIFVVDNASSDGSAAMIKKDFPYCKLIENKENFGFARANNQALSLSQAEYSLLLNSDTLVQDEALDKLLSFVKKNPRLGIASCKLLNKDGTIQPQGGYSPNLLRVFAWMFFIDDLPLINKFIKPYQLRNKSKFTRRLQLDWLSGTAMLIRRDLIKKIGLLNEGFFMYGEDLEYCLRCRQAGYQIAITPEAEIKHLSHKSSAGNPVPAWIGEFKAIKKIYKDYYPEWQYNLLRLFLKIGALLRIIIFGILQGRKVAYEGYKKAFQVA